MAVADGRPHIETEPEGDQFDADPGAAGVPVEDTTELRWIAQGHLPTEVEDWFTRGGTTGVVEKRCDTYRMDGRSDRGVKLRFREMLEIKVRPAVGEHLTFGAGLSGRLQMWSKWRPVSDVEDIGGDVAWLDVCKVVTKRRFSVDGDEIVPSGSARTMAGAGCDVEVAAITVGGVESWTFAFAAFGPTVSHEGAIVTAWQGLVADGRCPQRFADAFGLSSS